MDMAVNDGQGIALFFGLHAGVIGFAEQGFRLSGQQQEPRPAQPGVGNRLGEQPP
ncbi:hypothetical protein FACS189475_08220 [Betaproteobacteria bacterium]|nr:hypothetical protein FACS189475_08220 [Betaproteobacteria bacterium]